MTDPGRETTMDDDRELRKELAELDKKCAVLAQEMQTMQAEYLTALADLKTDMARRDTEAAKRHSDLTTAMAKRETWLLITFVGVVFALMTAGFTVMTFILRTGGAIPGA